jgi:hypothetical protein
MAVQGPGPSDWVIYSAKVSGSAFTDLAINTAKTFDAIRVAGWSTVLVQVDYTYSAGTAVTMTCDESQDGTTYYDVQEVECVVGTCTHVNRTWSKAISAASVAFLFEVPTRFAYLKCTLTATGGGAGDTATVQIYAQGS